MTPYNAPLEDMRFVLNHVVGLNEITKLPGFEGIDKNLTDQILEEAGKFSSNILAPLNHLGDTKGAQIENGVVRPVEGFGNAYKQWAQAGWNSSPFDADHGGQGLPWTLTTALWEMWDSANMAFSLCPLLTQAAIDALERHASNEQKETYLEKLVSGEWTGTMNLTEPQSGTDLGTIRASSIKEGDHYRVKGQKIYITWGDHDMTENIIHLVLARSPDGPPGSKGLSLFIVPKFLINADGSLGQRNDVRPVSIEHKIGIHASPTCVMSYGENDGAIGYLIGEENRGIEYMFVMMNNARLAVGLQGLAIAERAYQQAVSFAKERVQGKPIQGSVGNSTIIEHPDVRRMLLGMKSQIEAMRGLCYEVAADLDRANKIENKDEREKAQAMLELMIPVVKAWCTDTGLAITSTNIQVHGGMGFMEETGAGQHYRDARITTIYEGTNGVQAMDLLGRKVVRNGGETVHIFIKNVQETIDQLDTNDPSQLSISTHLKNSLDALNSAVSWMIETFPKQPGQAAAGATSFLEMMGLISGGWMLARGVIEANMQLKNKQGDKKFLNNKITTAKYFAQAFLSRAPSLLYPITDCGDSVMEFESSNF
ncbi:acyl-CoA dehydrogenase [Alphaproteobacteria bacterium]|nr:acyl-CoA dehydrogenase [Alphaproteobacteria bacterium]